MSKTNLVPQGNTMVPEGRRFFTGNFDVLLKHDNQNPDTRYAKRMAKKLLKAYLAGHEIAIPSKGFGVLATKAIRTPQIWVPKEISL